MFNDFSFITDSFMKKIMIKDEKPIFLIKEYEFIPSRFLLIHKSKEIKLEPKQSKILELFIQLQGQIVSREMLEEEVWLGRVVSEQAVNNKISELRKLFNDDFRNPKYFKTHPQLGYELITEVELKFPSEQKQEQEQEHTSTVNNKSTNILLIFVCLILIISAIYFAINSKRGDSPSNVTIKQAQLLPVTTEKGQEWGVNIHRSGEYLTYTYREKDQANWQIKIKNLKSGKEKTLTDKETNSQSPIWSAKDDSLYFIKNTEEACSIWKAQSVWVSPTYKQINECGDTVSISPLSIGPQEEWLYYTHLNKAGILISARVNLITNVSEPLTAPPSFSFGDYASSISPDGKQLAFLRAVSFSQTDLMILELSSGQIKKLNSFSHNIYRVSWRKNSEEIVYINSSNNLASINIKNQKSTELSHFQNKALAPYIDNKDNIYVVDGDFFVSDILKLNIKNKNTEEVVSSSYQDFALTKAHNKDLLAFTSNRSGIPQIWIKNNGLIEATTHFTKVSYIAEKLFTTENDRLIFIQDNDIKQLELTNNKIDTLISEQSSIEDIALTCDSSKLLFTSQNNGNWNLYAFSLASRTNKKIKSNTFKISSDCHNNKYYIQLANDNKIIQIDLNGNEVSFFDTNDQYILSWKVANNQLYLLTDNQIISIDLATKKETFTHTFDGFVVHNFIVHEQDIFLTTKRQTKTGIKKIYFK